jgi:tRNA (cmo5U34)-methyltransferase
MEYKMTNKVGDNISADRGNWTFGGDTPKNFDAHVSKSVPLYEEGHQLICDICDYFVKSDSLVYEIGCSTGTLTYKVAQHNMHKEGARFIGTDVVDEMIQQAELKRSQIPAADKLNIKFVKEDVMEMELEPADLIICYYTVQFIHPSIRQAVIDKFYQSLNWGGALLLFEKVRGADARFQDILTGLYTDYKLRMGYTPDDIVGKSRSLKGVLEPFSSRANIAMLERAGFCDINTVQKYICFEGFLAIK